MDPASLLKKLDRHFEEIERARSCYAKIGVPYHEVYYEDLVQDHARFDRILDFLGIDPRQHQYTCGLKKLAKGSHREQIENYQEIERALADTKYSCLLN